MAVFPCAKKGLCLDPSIPFANLSAELPDQEIFVGLNFGSAVSPPLGSDFTAISCLGIATSTISQEDADLDAAQSNADCTGTTFPVGVPGTDIYGNPVTIQIPRGVFRNTAQTATIACPDGLPFVYTVPAGRFSDTSQYQANLIAQSYAQQQAPNFVICLGGLSNPVVCAGQPYSDSITATGKPLSATGNFWGYVGGMTPPGIYSDIDLSFDAGQGGLIIGNTVNFYGACNVPGVYQFTVEVTAPDGSFFAKPYTITVPGITNGSTFAPGNVGISYSQEVDSAGVTNPIYSLESGTLPPGLSLDTTGIIFGIPTMAGTFNFSLGVTDAGSGLTCPAPCSITVTAAGLNFNSLTWSPPTFEQGDVSFSTDGAKFSANASGGADAPCNINNVIGMMTDELGPADCNLHVDWTLINPLGDTCRFQISVRDQNFNIYISQDLSEFNPTGPYDFPFSLPDATAAPLQLVVEWLASIPEGGPGGISFAGNASLTPAF